MSHVQAALDFSIETVFLHIKSCPLTSKNVKPTNSVQEGMMLILPYLEKTDIVQHKIISNMKDTKDHPGKSH